MDNTAQNFDAVIDSPIGALGICLEAGKLAKIDFLPTPAFFYASSQRALKPILKQLSHYFERAVPIEGLHLSAHLHGTVFQKRVWKALEEIPQGQTRSYGALAERLHSSAQAVGNACRANPCPIMIPCHRVVAKHHLGGFSGATDGPKLGIKTWLLEHEGALL